VGIIRILSTKAISENEVYIQMSKKNKCIKSPDVNELDNTGHELHKVIEKEFLPLVASYNGDQINLNIKYLGGEKPCKGLSRDEVKNAANQLTRICTARKGLLENEELLIKLNASLATFSKMDPRDSIEAMMITQLIAIQEMTMLMAERALIADQPSEYIDQCVNRTTKLARSHASLVEAFTKYRTKGIQKITVQHVTVSDGGQAVIGDLHQGGGGE
jgi:hypothetical protein